jgi:hypothetical protein
VKGLEWWAQGFTFHTTMRVLDIGDYDAILGYDWLSAHSPMVCHWDKKVLQFQEAGQQVAIQGLKAGLAKLECMSLKQFVKWHHGNDIWALAVVQSTMQSEVGDIPEDITKVVQEFTVVFEEPTALPPHREYDHTIPLLPNVLPVNARPYRYSPLHKDEIEKQVKHLLQTGLISPSTIPFASHVLLVQKKDET